MESDMSRMLVDAIQKHTSTGMPLDMIVVETPQGPMLRRILGNIEEIARFHHGVQNGTIDSASPQLFRAIGAGEGDYT